MYSRFTNRNIFINDNKDYKDKFLVNRDLNQIVQYSTARFRYPTAEEAASITSTPLIWSSNSRLFNIASEYYGSAGLWWVIAWYNKRPTEAHFKIGETIYIPTPIEIVLDFFRT